MDGTEIACREARRFLEGYIENEEQACYVLVVNPLSMAQLAICLCKVEVQLGHDIIHLRVRVDESGVTWPWPFVGNGLSMTYL